MFGRVTVLIIGCLLVSHMHGMSIYMSCGKKSVLTRRSALLQVEAGTIHVGNC